MAKKEERKLTFAEILTEEFGDHIIEKEESIHDIKKLRVIPTGSTSLDVSLGVGGIPRGRITTIYGPESAAKTTLCLSIAKNALKETKVLYVDQENSVDHSYISAIVGEYNKDNLTLVQPETAEQTLMICEKGIESGEYGLIILDSVGALAPTKEKEDDFDKASVGVVPRLLSKFLRRNAFAIRDKNVAFVFINQVRAVIGAYVPTMEMPGGNALRHFSSIIIYMHRSELLKYGDDVVGAVTKYTVKKNKVGKPFKSFSFPLIFGVGINKSRDTIEFAELLGLVLRKGSYYYYKSEALGQGLAKAEEYLNSHQEVLDKIAKECYNINNKVTEERNEDAENTDSKETL